MFKVPVGNVLLDVDKIMKDFYVSFRKSNEINSFYFFLLNLINNLNVFAFFFPLRLSCHQDL